MKKGLSLTAVILLIAISVSAHDIELKSGGVPGIGEPTCPRTIESEVTASIDGQVITVSFDEMTASQIVVTDSSDLQVFNQTYSPAFSVQANLSTLPFGSYTIHIYASGYWWYGYFVLE